MSSDFFNRVGLTKACELTISKNFIFVSDKIAFFVRNSNKIFHITTFSFLSLNLFLIGIIAIIILV